VSFTATISKQISTSAEVIPTSAARITVSVTAVTGFSDKGLFLAQEIAGTTTFVTVCSAYALSAYKLDKADATTGYKRVSSMEAVSPNATDAQTSLTAIEDAITRLCHEKELLSTMTAPVTVTLP
jgi:hypothetical protein